MRISLATCETLPHLFADDQLLAAALRARGARVEPLIWSSPEGAEACPDLCVLRNTWDYYLRLPDFLAWAEGMAGRCSLVNPLPLVQWNAHKSYLLQLATRQIPSVPTFLVRQGRNMNVAIAAGAVGWSEVVIKPAVSAGAHRTARFATTDPAAQSHLEDLARDVDALIQPFLPGVSDPGERSLVFIGGTFSHAVRRTQAMEEGVGLERLMTRVEPSAEELDVACRVLAALPAEPIFVRVDLVQGLQGTPVVMEVEAIEPRLFLQECPEAVDRLADALMQL